MSALDWVELDRDALADRLPRALVVVPIGAVEQHGHHLPTGTDSLVSGALARAAAERAAADLEGDVIVTPQQWVGASDHHLPFGGTLSLRPATLLAVLEDVLASVAGAGARRIVLVNGHGGNTGLCHAAAAAASARHGLAVAHLDYWQLLPTDVEADGAPVPGHAGAFETSLVLALRPELVKRSPDRADPPDFPSPTGTTVHSAPQWSAIDGYTDHPERASEALGRSLQEELVTQMARVFVELGSA
jgi:creatinine amidohydrolase